MPTTSQLAAPIDMVGPAISGSADQVPSWALNPDGTRKQQNVRAIAPGSSYLTAKRLARRERIEDGLNLERDEAEAEARAEAARQQVEAERAAAEAARVAAVEQVRIDRARALEVATERVCGRCRQVVPRSGFTPSRWRTMGSCRACTKATNREARQRAKVARVQAQPAKVQPQPAKVQPQPTKVQSAEPVPCAMVRLDVQYVPEPVRRCARCERMVGRSGYSQSSWRGKGGYCRPCDNACRMDLRLEKLARASESARLAA